MDPKDFLWIFKDFVWIPKECLWILKDFWPESGPKKAAPSRNEIQGFFAPTCTPRGVGVHL